MSSSPGSCLRALRAPIAMRIARVADRRWCPPPRGSPCPTEEEVAAALDLTRVQKLIWSVSFRVADPPVTTSDAPPATNVPGPTTYAVTCPVVLVAHGGAGVAAHPPSLAPFHVGPPAGALASV
jgi:hypothetical protein